MTWIDYTIFALYMALIVGIGVFYFIKNKDAEDYYVGGRNIKSHHVGLSIVATDVGGGFSIGLGGLGFTMGLSGSWMLFTGFLGAWLSAVFLIPRVKKIDRQHGMYSYPDFLRVRYSESVALLAALISGIGYLGFTGGQILAGAKLAAATIFDADDLPLGLAPLEFSLYTIAAIAILYTVIGGLKAVIYTDTVQWLFLLGGLIFVAIPVSIIRIGGIDVLLSELPREFFNPFDIFISSPATFINWMVTIVPIWLIGMTLYQRMFACRDEKEAKRAWYIAGVFEWPIMAFMGVILGMCARVLYPEVEAEMGLPTLIKNVLPAGVTGIVIAAYFSAIMSTADSCLMASSGNFVNDIIERHFAKGLSHRGLFILSMIVTAIIGILALSLASQFTTVLDAIIYAYAFMVSGLFIPTLGAYFWEKGSSVGAFFGMLTGGTFTIVMQVLGVEFWGGLDPTLFGILISGFFYVTLSLIFPAKSQIVQEAREG